MESPLHRWPHGPPIRGCRRLLRRENAGGEKRDRQCENGASHSCTTNFIRGSIEEGTVRETCAST